MQYMGGKSRIAKPISEILNIALSNGGGAEGATMRYLGGKSRISKPISIMLTAALRERESIRKSVLWLMCG